MFLQRTSRLTMERDSSSESEVETVKPPPSERDGSASVENIFFPIKDLMPSTNRSVVGAVILLR